MKAKAVGHYTVDCEWDGYNWVATVEGVPGAVTQARRLDLIPDRVIEVLKLMTGKTVARPELHVRFHPGGDVEHEADDVRSMRAEIERLQGDLSVRLPRLVRTLRAQGFTVRDIGTLVDLSHQRVQQLLASSTTTAGRRAPKRP